MKALARREVATAGALLAILIASVYLWGPLWNVYIIRSDDAYLMGYHRQLAAGEWKLLLAPQAIHIVPVYRLLRLYFDLHFPERFHWMHVPVVAAHLASVAFLFALSRKYLRAAEAALIVAGLFAFHTWGGEAVIIKSQSTYVLSLPLLLGGLYFLVNRRCRWACAVCLMAAIGMHSLAAAAAIPGILLGYYLLGRQPERRDAAAWACCAIPLLAGVAAWLIWCLPGLDVDHHFQGAPRTLTAVSGRIWNAFGGLFFHFAFILRHRPPTPALLALGTLGLAALLWFSRKQPGARWLLTALAIAVGPLLASFLLRTGEGYPVSRYAYQSFTVVAVAGGVALDLVVSAIEHRRALLAATWLLLLAGAVVYFRAQKESLEGRVPSLQEGPGIRRDYWIAWDNFLDRTAAEARASGRQFRLPFLELDPDRNTQELFWLCNPRGNPGIVALPRGYSHAADCVNFWRKIHEARKTPSPFDRAPLRASMVIVGEGEEVPPGDHLVCRVKDREGQPRILYSEESRR